MDNYPNFKTAIEQITERMRLTGRLHQGQRWQGRDVGHKPEMATYELLLQSFRVPVALEDLDYFREDIGPNLPWADDHFLERVGGAPINPGETWKDWPYANSAGTFLEGGQFNHNYMERFWPKYAGYYVGGPSKTPEGWRQAASHHQPDTNPRQGIRYTYGDLGDVVNQLAQEPDTRQAYLPVFFPEDTGGVHRGRVPCSLGYHFMYREGFLHMTYSLRSCELVRHFRDDIYLAVRLLLWMLDQLRHTPHGADVNWNRVQPGFLKMDIANLHLFKNDWVDVFGSAPK